MVTPRVSQATTAASVARSAVGVGIGTAAISLVSLVVTPVLVDGLGPDDYGVWVTIATLGVLLSLADLGVRTEVVRRVAVARAEGDSAAATRAVNEGVGALLTGAAIPVLAMLATVPLWTNRLLDDAEVPGVAWITAAVLLITTLEIVSSTYHAVLIGAQRAHVEQAGRVAGVTATALIGAVSVQAGAGIWSLVAARAVGLLVTTSTHHVAVRRAMPDLAFHPRFPARGVGWLQLPVLALFSQIADVVDSQTDKIVIASIGGGTAVTGYHVATTLIVQVRSLALSLLSPLLGGLSELHATQPERARMLYRRACAVLYAVGVPTLGTVASLGGPFIRFWIPAELPDAGPICAVFGIAMVVNLFSAPLTLRAIAEKLHPIVAVSAAVNIVLNLAASVALTIAIGPVGAAFGSLAGTIAGVIYIVVAYWRRTGDWPLSLVHRFLPILGAFGCVLALGSARWEPSPVQLAVALAGLGGITAVGSFLVVRNELPTAGEARAMLRRNKPSATTSS